MPITYTVEFGNSYVKTIAKGILTTEEVCNYASAIESDDNIKEGFVELFDVSLITESKIDKNGFEQIAQIVRAGKKRSKRSKLAIVVAKGSSFDNARYYEHLAIDVHNVIVFNSREVAEVWLGIRKQS